MAFIETQFYDAFTRGTVRQASHRVASWKVKIGGRDISNRLDPYLIAIKVNDAQSGITCQIEVDDRDGRMDIPAVGTPVEVHLGWQSEGTEKVFDGSTDHVEYSCNRQSGRHMTVHGWGANALLKLKEPMMQYMGAGAPPGSEIGMAIPFIKAATKFVQTGGATIQMHPKLAKMTKDYWGQVNESPLHWVNRMARELGGIARVVGGNKFQVQLPGEGLGTTTNITAVWGENLIGLRVVPLSARSMWKQGSAAWYSRLAGQWKTLAQQFGGLTGGGSLGGIANAVLALPMPAPNSMAASNNAGGAATSNKSQDGKITIDGDPRATGMGGHVMVSKVRSGVDGDYVITDAEHVYSRETGYICNLSVYINPASIGAGNTGAGPGAGPPVRN